jgi:hypothetical protein
VIEFGGTGVFEAVDLAALGVHSGHHVPDGAVLASRIHRLENQEDGVAVTCVKKSLQAAQFLDLIFQEFVVLLLRLVHRLDACRVLVEVERSMFGYLEVTGIDLLHGQVLRWSFRLMSHAEFTSVGCIEWWALLDST